uniref:Saposin B-type domain-containing protein n=1 Tax=Angiostrongylus cantonensis TaxID=6313 RepID=A0A0K0CXK8_ANGCA
MKFIVLFMAVATCLAFDKESMLKYNKISNEPVSRISVQSACDECQSLVRRINEAAKDPEKLDELKMVLRVLCHETSYVDECRMFVSKLDVIVKKLEPYLKDLVCDECQFAARELKTIVEDKDKQKEIHDFLSQNICIHLGSYRGMCDTLIEQFLPELFQELDSLLQNPRQVCSDAGFCPKLAPPREMVGGIVGFLTRL